MILTFILPIFLSKTLFYHIYNITYLHGKILYIIKNVCDLEDIFLLIDIYITPIFDLFIDCLLIKR